MPKGYQKDTPRIPQVTPSKTKVTKVNGPISLVQFGFLEAPLVRQADGELKN